MTAMCLRNGILTCADGFVLMSTPADPEKDEVLKDELYPVGMLKVSGDGFIRVQREPEGFKVRTFSKNGKETEPVKNYQTVVMGTFPDYNKLFPVDEPITEIAFNADKLSQILDCLPRKSVVHFAFYGKVKPVEILIDDGKEFPTRGIIMPMFSDRLNTWAKDDRRWCSKAVSLAEALDYLTKKEMPVKLHVHEWGTDGAHTNEFCKTCFIEKPKEPFKDLVKEISLAEALKSMLLFPSK